MELKVGNVYKRILCENYLDKSTNRIRVRPLEGQNVPVDIVLECSRSTRESHPLGTHFIAPEVKVCTKPTGRLYLREKNQNILLVD